MGPSSADQQPAWELPPSVPPPAPGMFGAVAPRDLTLGNAIEGAFRSLAKPAFIGPILVISVLINAVLEITLQPIIARSVALSPTGRPTIEDINAFLGAAAVSFVVALIGGIIVALYGSVWAVTASIGPAPTIGETLRLAGRRWVGVLGTGLVVGLITIAAVIAGVVVLGLLSQISAAIGFGVAIGLGIVFIYFVARLYMASWLAADGVSVMGSVQGSWRMTEGQVLRILGWSIVYGLLFALVAAAAGAVLGLVPLIGGGIAQGLSLALGYGAGVALYRKTQANAAPPAVAPSAPPVTDTTIG
jgi:hypothetical protein